MRNQFRIHFDFYTCLVYWMIVDDSFRTVEISIQTYFFLIEKRTGTYNLNYPMDNGYKREEFGVQPSRIFKLGTNVLKLQLLIKHYLFLIMILT